MKKLMIFLRILGFAILGAIVGYLILPFVTPIMSFATEGSDFSFLRGVNVFLGIMVGIWYGFGPSTLKWHAIIGGLIGAFVERLVGRFIAFAFVSFFWGSVLKLPEASLIVTDILDLILWLLAVSLSAFLFVKGRKFELTEAE